MMNEHETTTTQQKFYKVLTATGESMHGGDLKWSLPRKRGKGWQSGAWHEVEGEVVVCSSGLHLTTQPYKWWNWDAVVWEAEGSGDCDTDGDDKIAFRKARLLKPAPEPEFIVKAKEFISTIADVKWFTPDGPPNATWKMFGTRDAASAAARDAVKAAARGAVAARDAAWDATWNAAWAAASAADRDAARDAVKAAARTAVGAGDAAWDARLMVLTEGVCFDLGIDQKHREHARARWDVWQRGYGLLCDVNGVLYVYKSVR